MTMLSLLFVAVFSFAGGNVVGNGGDGFLFGNEIRVRDLVETKTDETPWIGPRIDPMLPRGPLDEALKPLAWPTEPLLRKLTDVNELKPGLADLLIAVARSYQWKLTDAKESLTPEKSLGLIERSELQRVQIAIRKTNVVEIQRAAWAKMTDAHKVALILHEIATSLIKPAPFSMGYSVQIQFTERFRVGLLFDRRLMTAALGSEDLLRDRLLGLKESFHLPIDEIAARATIVSEKTSRAFDPRANHVFEDVRSFCQTATERTRLSLRWNPMIIRQVLYLQAASLGIVDARKIEVDRPVVKNVEVPTENCEANLRQALGTIRAAILAPSLGPL